MNKIGFVGAFDKTDLMLYLAKICTELNKKVLIIDSTITQKAKYVVPVINPSKTYITTFEDFDVAVGFKNFDEIREYLGVTEGELEYDLYFVDTDSHDILENFNLRDAATNYFVTSFDMYSIKKGLEIISGITDMMKMTKVMYSKNMLKEEVEYLNFISTGYKVEWSESQVYFPFEQGDQTVIMENQRVEKIKFRNLSSHYKASLLYMAEEILPDVNPGEIKKVFKIIERGV